jgi:hypothetical protein
VPWEDANPGDGFTPSLSDEPPPVAGGHPVDQADNFAAASPCRRRGPHEIVGIEDAPINQFKLIAVRPAASPTGEVKRSVALSSWSNFASVGRGRPQTAKLR